MLTNQIGFVTVTAVISAESKCCGFESCVLSFKRFADLTQDLCKAHHSTQKTHIVVLK